MSKIESALKRIQEEARAAAQKTDDINAACRFPFGSWEAAIFKQEFNTARSQIDMAGMEVLEHMNADDVLCTCTGLDGYTTNELNTGTCDECGKAVVL